MKCNLNLPRLFTHILGIVIEFDAYQDRYDEYNSYNHYENYQLKETVDWPIKKTSISLIDLINYINPSNTVSDREVIMSIIDHLLCIDNEMFDRFKSANLILNNLTRTCSTMVMNKFESLGAKIHHLYDFINDQLDDDDFEADNITLYTYLITLRKLLNRNVHRVILRIDDQISLEAIEFKSLWHFYQYLNGGQCDHLVDKVCLLNSINLNLIDCGRPPSTIQQVNQLSKFQNYSKLVCILDQLYLNLQFPTNENRYLWILFLNCFKPTLKYLQDFLINGYQTDANNEFYFENVNYQYESDFWSTCLAMRCPNRIPVCLKKCWTKLVNGLKSRLLMRYADEKFEFDSFSLYDEFVDDLFSNLGFHRKQSQTNDERSIKSPEPLTSNAFSYDYLNQINSEVSKLFSSVESIDRTSNHTISSSLDSDLNDLDSINADLNGNLETKLKNQAYNQMDNYENINLNLVEFKKQFNQKELDLYEEDDEHELDRYAFGDRNDDRSEVKQIKIYFNDSLVRSLDKIIAPISRQVSQLFKKDYIDYLRFFNDYYLMQLEQHSFSLFFDTLFEKLINDPIGFQDNLYSRVYDLRDFGFENTNLIIFLKFSETFQDDLIYFDIISRLNLLYKDLDWTSSTIINNDAQDFYNRACKVLMKIKFIKWLTNNLPTLNRDFNLQRQRKLPIYKLFHKLFLIKHNLAIVLDTLHSSILVKIHSLQFNLYTQNEQSSNYEELVDVFQHYLEQVGIILHLDVFNQNEDDRSSPFHSFIRKLCEKAIDIWKIWFSIERLFYTNYDQHNTHKQLWKCLDRIDAIGSKRILDSKLAGNKANTKANAKMNNNGGPNVKIEMNGKANDSLKVKKQFEMNGDTKVNARELINLNTKHTRCPDHFDLFTQVDEINLKLDEISKFLKANAEIFQV